MKVLLAYLCQPDDSSDYFMSLLPYGVVSIAAFLEKEGVDVALANYSASGVRGALAEMRKLRPDILGLSLFSFNRAATLELVKKASKEFPAMKIVLGGPHATFMAEGILQRYPEVDLIIKGEGENAMLAAVRDYKAKRDVPRIVEASRITDISSLPPASSYGGPVSGVNAIEQFRYIVTSRGCPGSCTFCSSPSFWQRKTVFRSADDIYNEFRELYEKYGIIYFSVRDDNFTMRKQRVMDFCSRIIQSGMKVMWNCQARVDSVDFEMLAEMKSAGLEHIQYGVESGSPAILSGYHKNISVEKIEKAAEATRRAGIYLSIYLMSGMAGETREDCNRTLALIRRIRPHDGMVSPVSLYPGTAMYEEFKESGRVDDSVWFETDSSGVYLREDREAGRMFQSILNELELTGEGSVYRPDDFKRHREECGESWVTDVMEGDFLAQSGDLEGALNTYRRLAGCGNIWGFERSGGLFLQNGRYDEAEEAYRGLLNLVPNYSGGFVRLSEVLFLKGDIAGGEWALDRAESLNCHDSEIKLLRRRFGKHKS